MDAKQKIAKVLKEIKDEREINPDSKWVKFNFNTSVFGAGILSDDEEKRILSKLEKEGTIKLHLHLPGEDNGGRGILSGEATPGYDYIWIEILEGFGRKYQLYKFYLSGANYWNLINPFWWLWELIRLFYKLLKIFWKHKIFAFFILILGWLAVDYSLAWKNIKFLISLIGKLLK